MFEGSSEQMVDSLGKLQSLPDATAIYCAHEYTEANLTFAAAVEPNNSDVAGRLATVRSIRQSDGITLPSTIASEKATNPFLRCQEHSVQAAAEKQCTLTNSSHSEIFAAIRGWKDNF